MTKPSSAGILLYRFLSGQLEILLVHPGGPFWKNKDEGAWTIPKGEVEKEEEGLETAKREFEEETGSKPVGPFRELTPVRQKAGKMVKAWAAEGDLDTSLVRSSTFDMEWPPHSGRRQSFPEIDRAAWFDIETARVKMNAGQVGLVDELVRVLLG
ncbi:MAG TPA: NUDIX domain-containing protein [Chitinophagaceae bacterium]|nr:NUDIX domain-containing protein [Chitinophagaceae bacterium]